MEGLLRENTIDLSNITQYPEARWMKNIINRIGTYVGTERTSLWTHLELARAGFYDTGDNGILSCPWCEKKIEKHTLRKTKYLLTLQSQCPFLGQEEEEERDSDTNTISGRLGTFYYTWPRKQTPYELASAGFIRHSHEKYNDAVQCTCCKVLMHNWLDTDDPYVEHAVHGKSYCEYLLRNKGQGYKKAVLANYKNITAYMLLKKDNKHLLTEKASTCNGFALDESRLLSFLRQPKVKQALYLGFEMPMVAKTYRHQLEVHGADFENDTAFVSSLLHNSNEDIILRTRKLFPDLASYPQVEEEQVQEQDQCKMCKFCKTKRANTIFLPCGHMAYCIGCTRELEMETCFLCRRHIKETVSVCFQLHKETRTGDQKLRNPCIVCKNKESEVLSKECGHFVTCTDCAFLHTTCPIDSCGREVRETFFVAYRKE